MCKFKVGDIVVMKKGKLSFDITNDSLATKVGGIDTELVVREVSCLGVAGSRHALCEIKVRVAGRRGWNGNENSWSSLRFNLREVSTNSFTPVNVNDILATLK